MATIDRPQRKIRPLLAGAVALAITGALACMGHAVSDSFDDCRCSFVSDRPDLTHGGAESWAKAHTADFVPLQKARYLKIAITQACLAPAPETLIAQFSLSASDLRSYLRGKQLRSDSLDSVVAQEAKQGLDYENDTYRHLSWWPPKPVPTLKTYSARDRSGIDYHVFVDTNTGTVTVIAPASRGR